MGTRRRVAEVLGFLLLLTLSLGTTCARASEIRTFNAAKWGMNFNDHFCTCVPPALAFSWTVGGGWYDDRHYLLITFENQIFGPTQCYADGGCYFGYVVFESGIQGGLRRSVGHGAITLAPTFKAGNFMWLRIPHITIAAGIALGISDQDVGRGFQFVFEPKIRVLGEPGDESVVLELSFYWGTVEWE